MILCSFLLNLGNFLNLYLKTFIMSKKHIFWALCNRAPKIHYYQSLHLSLLPNCYLFFLPYICVFSHIMLIFQHLYCQLLLSLIGHFLVKILHLHYRVFNIFIFIDLFDCFPFVNIIIVDTYISTQLIT